MKLSEAIRAGCQGSVKCLYSFDDGKGGRCAMGAAFFARFGYAKFGYVQETYTTWPVLSVMTKPPVDMSSHSWYLAENGTSRVLDIVVVLNNYFSWSREAIAEWVETIEKKLEAGDKGEDAKGVTNSPPPCALEKTPEYTPVESTLSV